MALAPAAAAAFDPAKDGASPAMVSKTCQNCFMLKIRCDRTQRSDICDRCARLGKHCVFRPARRRDNSAKRDSRIQALEQQVQDLLRTQPSTPLTQQSLPEAAPSIASSSSPGLDPGTPGDVIDEDIVTMERARTLVELYKSDMMPHFPFVMIPPHVTGSSLRHEKPFLFLAILSVASYHDLTIQERLGHRFIHLVSEKVLMGGDDYLSCLLEQLQGLLVVLAWNHYHGQGRYGSQLLSLAISLAVDMRLDRKPICPKPLNPGSKRDPLAGTWGTPTWGPEEQRAAAGIFYMSSTISKLFDKMNTFPCTHFIEEGCLALQQKGEYKTDKDLYHVIRLQRIIETVDTLANQSSSDAEAQAAFLRTRSELEDLRAFLVSDVTDSHLLFMQFHTAKLFLYHVAFFERSLQHHPALHLNTLREGLESAKSFLDLYLWLPPKSEMNLTNWEWLQLNFGVTLAAKFAIVSKDPNVELQTRELRHRLNIDNVFRHLSLRIGALVGRAGVGNKQRDVFAYYEQRVGKIQNWFERMVRATGSDSLMSHQTNMAKLTPQTQNLTISQQQSQTLPLTSPAPSMQTGPQAPITTTRYSPQPSISYPSEPMSTTPGTNAAIASMSPSPNSNGYSPVPQIAFPDLMSAPGWDDAFSIPMEDTSWMFDMSTTYQA